MIAPDDYPVGAFPNAWGPVIQFQRGFVYQGGPLLLEIGMTGISGRGLVDDVFAGSAARSAYGQADGFNTATADLGIYNDMIVVEYKFARP